MPALPVRQMLANSVCNGQEQVMNLTIPPGT